MTIQKTLTELNLCIEEYEIIKEKEVFDEQVLEWTRKSLFAIQDANQLIEDAIVEDVEGMYQEYDMQRADLVRERNTLKEQYIALRFERININNKKIDIETSIDDLNRKQVEAEENLKSLEHELSGVEYTTALEKARVVRRKQGVYKRRLTLIERHISEITPENREHKEKLIRRLKDKNIETGAEISAMLKYIRDETTERAKALKEQIDTTKKSIYDRNRYIKKLNKKLDKVLYDIKQNIDEASGKEDRIAEVSFEINRLESEMLAITEYKLLIEPKHRLHEYTTTISDKVQYQIVISYYIRTAYVPQEKNKHSGTIQLEGVVSIAYNFRIYDEHEHLIVRNAFERTIFGISYWLHDNINGIVANATEERYTDWDSLDKTLPDKLSFNTIKVAIMTDEKKIINMLLKPIDDAKIESVRIDFVWISSGGHKTRRTNDIYEDINRYVENSLDEHIKYVEKLNNDEQNKNNKN